MKGGDDSGCRTAAATGRSGAELEIAPAAAQFAGDGRRRPHGYEVRGWVGSADITDDSRFGHIDMVSAVRSPGSVLKPFIYAMAMDEGLIHPASLLQDVPRRFSDYRPGNFDSGFHGPVSASEALVRSLNLPAVQVLEAYGPKRFAANLRNAGLPLTLPAGAEPNLSLILGGAGARLERYCRGVQRLRPPWQGGAAAPEAERSIDRAR